MELGVPTKMELGVPIKIDTPT